VARKQPKRHDRPGVDRYGRAPLHYAALEGRGSDVIMLLEAGADAGAADDDGWTPLHAAAQGGHAHVLELLLGAGAAVDARDSYGNTPLFRAVFTSNGDGTLIGVLRRAGADPHLHNNHGVSPVSLARTIANYDVAQFFADLPA
jgi:ankyrin repeat protein